jgi:NADH-ubiquinone oxidoreductase chain 4
MILAGVLLKLGGYGIMRVLGFNFALFKGGLNRYIVGLSLVGMLYVGLVCCRLNDFKALVAYSTVAHIALVIRGLLRMFCWGWLGAFVIIVAHGLSSSGLFCLVNMYYERTMRRRFYINRGLLMGFPIFSLIMFLLAAANIAAPPTINLVSEIFLMVRILGFDYVILIVFPLGSFFGAVFTLFIFSYSQHGLMYVFLYGFNFSNFREFHILSLHVIPLNILVLNLGVFLV